METKKPIRIKSISELHVLRGLPKPEHPLISVVNFGDVKHTEIAGEISWIFDFYQIAVKRGMDGKFKYGQQNYNFDFEEGVMFFTAPNQVFSFIVDPQSTQKRSGWMLLIHPDFLWNTTLGNSIRNYEFFDYSVNEALFLSIKEEKTLQHIIENIRLECHANLDKFSKHIIISQIETLLNYSDRFYNRQFITREKINHQILEHLEKLLAEYFNTDDLISKGLPTVHFIADKLHLSSKYLSNVLRTLTGQTTQQHIHNHLIERAKEKLSTTNLSVSEIAYELGFEHPQSLSKLFKSKTQLSPLEFRASFN